MSFSHSGALKKVPTFFRLEIQNIEFQICDGFFSLRDLQGSQEVVSSGENKTYTNRYLYLSMYIFYVSFATHFSWICTIYYHLSCFLGTCINVVIMTKRGPGKSSTLKQLQATTTAVGGHVLCAKFQENFDFKASLFYETDGTCIPKLLRLNVNRVCRIEDSNEYSVLLMGYVDVQLHDVPNTGENVFQIPLTVIDSKSILGTLTVKIIMFENKRDFDLDDDASVSSIGSNLSFMQKENISSVHHKKTSSTPTSIQNRTASRRKTGGHIPEAGLPSRFSRSSSAEVETLLTEMSIIKMHLDKALADKSNMEATHKDDMREVAQLRLERVTHIDTLKAQEEQITDLLRNNDMLCKAMTKLQCTLVAKEKEINALKQERKVYLKNDRILDLKDQALLAELTKAADQIPTTSNMKPLSFPPHSSNVAATDCETGEDNSKDYRGSLFEPDEVDSEASATLKQMPSKAVLFNEDVIELLWSHTPPAELNKRRSSTSNLELPSSSNVMVERRPLFTDDDEEAELAVSVAESARQDRKNEYKGRSTNKVSKGPQEPVVKQGIVPKGGGGSSATVMATASSKRNARAVHVRSTSPSGFVTYTSLSTHSQQL